MRDKVTFLPIQNFPQDECLWTFIMLYNKKLALKQAYSKQNMGPAAKEPLEL